MPFVSDPDMPPLKVSARDDFSLRDAVKDVLVIGYIGSGKSSATKKDGIEPQPDRDIDR